MRDEVEDAEGAAVQDEDEDEEEEGAAAQDEEGGGVGDSPEVSWLTKSRAARVSTGSLATRDSRLPLAPTAVLVAGLSVVDAGTLGAAGSGLEQLSGRISGAADPSAGTLNKVLRVLVGAGGGAGGSLNSGGCLPYTVVNTAFCCFFGHKEVIFLTK